MMSCGVSSIGHGSSLAIASCLPAEVQATSKIIDGNVVFENEKCCNAAVGNGAIAVKNNSTFELPLVPRIELH
jgi:hypothetical protein